MTIDLILYIFVFFFGLIIGSFLNSVIYRLEKEESFLFERSYCPDCHHQLSWKDLIPLLSYLFLNGKCRYCSERISFQYPFVEILTAFLFLTALSLRVDLGLFYWWAIISVLVVILVYDFKHYIIPDKMVYPGIVIVFLYHLIQIFYPINNFEINNLNLLLNPLVSAVLASGFFFLIVFISQGKWMGMGDVKLAFLMGLLLSSPNILIALFLAFLFGAIMGVGLILLQRKTLKSEVPFGPFLITGTFISMFWGERIINWYLSLFL